MVSEKVLTLRKSLTLFFAVSKVKKVGKEETFPSLSQQSVIHRLLLLLLFFF